MKGILISGKENTGKTTICKILEKHIKDQKGFKKEYRYKIFANDFNAVYEINNIYIAINSSGDNESIITENIKQTQAILKKEDINLDYYFLTSRTRGKGFHKASDFLEENTNEFERYYFNSSRINEDTDNTDNFKEYFLQYILTSIGLVLDY